ncbi:MAG: alpha/beta fold hydrolase [Tatlockia sp.]|nr:alpha/beta fold hydrolase [Tatlockia sp.]
MKTIEQSTVVVNCPQFGAINLELLSCMTQEKMNKPALLFIHGSFHAAWCWAEHFMPYLASHGYPAYALSLRGHGASEGHHALDEYNLNHYVDDVAATIATFEEPPVLIGHSYGGVVVQQYLQRTDNQCKNIILLASPKPRNASRAAVFSALRHPLQFIKLMKFNKGKGKVPEALFFSKELTAETRQGYLQRFQRQSKRVFSEFKLFGIEQIPAMLSSCLVMIADKGDKFVSLKAAKDTARFYSGELKTLSFGAHDMMLENQWQQAADVIRVWLEEKTDSKPAPGSYQFEAISINARHELKRLQAQVDLFWKQELQRYQAYGLKDGMKILDAGCGWAYLTTKLCQHFHSVKVTALDQDPEMIKYASHNLHEKKLQDRVSLVQNSITSSQLESNQFDFVIARLLLEHLPDPSLGLAEIYRVLKPGGTVVLINNDFDFHTWTYPKVSALKAIYNAYKNCRQAEGGHPTIGRSLPALLSKAGFKEVEFDMLVSHNAIVGDQLFFDSEGMGIPLKLVQQGYLSSNQLSELVKEWNTMLVDSDHIMMRKLFMGIGKKP